MVKLSEFIEELRPINTPSTADILDKDKHGRLVIGTKKWIAHIAQKAFDKYKNVHRGLFPTVNMGYPYKQNNVPTLVVYNVTGLRPHPTSRMIGYNIVEGPIQLEEHPGKEFNVRMVQYAMTLGLDYWANSTFERDAGMDILVNEAWVTRRIELGVVGITVVDVNVAGFREEFYGTDKVYGVGITLELLIEIMYFENVDTGDIILDFRQGFVGDIDDRPDKCV